LIMPDINGSGPYSPLYGVDIKIRGNRVQQILEPHVADGTYDLSAVVESPLIDLGDDPPTALAQHCGLILASWNGQFQFRAEHTRPNGAVEVGLRSPQIGALYASLAHWTVSEEPATIVMPTGTGKTETMLALAVQQRLSRLLVVVPTAPLREQTVRKFLSLGLLKQLGAVGTSAHLPMVGTLQHQIATPDDVEIFFRSCNVVVATMQVISRCSEMIQRAIADVCSHLFIDEAHHISAPTWERFRRFFLDRPVVQFTATPFRRDGKLVDGKIIYTYPLRKAQEEGYFKPITFLPIQEYSPRRTDEAIARMAVERLAADLEAGHNHLVMARADTIEQAQHIHAIYQRIGERYDPCLIHSQQSVAAKREGLQRLRAGTSRIVICVDMLGEGFDLPQLKIAALHDIHKSLAITLQFIGRFTRTAADVGDATVIANIPDADVDEVLRGLYAEDPDWNVLLRRLSEGATERELRRSTFLDGFVNAPKEIALHNVLPKMSTVVYRTIMATEIQTLDWANER
jgi:superfamily II DNA or RNA helicase